MGGQFCPLEGQGSWGIWGPSLHPSVATAVLCGLRKAGFLSNLA